MKERTLNRMFWLIWNEQASAPKSKHWSLQEARIEAQRLAQKHPNTHFHVLALTGTCAYQALVWSEPDRVDDDFRQF